MSDRIDAGEPSKIGGRLREHEDCEVQRRLRRLFRSRLMPVEVGSLHPVSESRDLLLRNVNRWPLALVDSVDQLLELTLDLAGA
ncbi:hypothetical protein [Mesorhizobium sangaii]|uniref:Uncharacterized protein n=1 Tax=Mesorhizobium sangaii TaxID=505389 RepID=A0A841PIT3_9HYPH|nr:hypothetical protein [Mesorhizobium sangaii]MBB6413533.1 hypothetical protein [Mesorhizobium sangaii]